MSIGRNEPCPCGSGRKYKNCHYASDRASGAAQRAADAPSPLHEMDNRLVLQILEAIANRFPRDFDEATHVLDTYDPPPELAFPWLAWIEMFEGRTAAEWYVEARGWSLSPGVAEWIGSQRAATLSVWQVREVSRGRITLEDQLTGDVRVVHDVKMSEALEPHLYLLTRIVDHRGASVAAGTHANPLPPLAGARVVEKARRVLRRKTNVPRERLRDIAFAYKLLDAWCDELDRMSTPPEMRNTDGDEILLSMERWSFDPANRNAIVDRLLTLDGADMQEKQIAIVRESDDTLLAMITVLDGALEVTTNSLLRADAIRTRIEESCGTLVTRGLRTHTDPQSMFAEAVRGKDDSPSEVHEPEDEDEPEDEEFAAFVREQKERHYAAWLDDPLPYLGGQTPRAAARTAAGRRKLIPLLQHIESIERRESEAKRFDIGVLRKELGVEET